jgi:protein-disulfide isomerase
MSKASEVYVNVMFGVSTLLLAVATTFVVTGGRRHPPPHPPGQFSHRSVTDWREVAQVGHRVGPVGAPVTIVEFGDYQCPFCAKFAAVLDSVSQRHPNDVAIVYRHLPLPMHAHARVLALAAECADAQGYFAPFQRLLYANQDSVGTIGWEGVAIKQPGLNRALLSKCVRDSTYLGRIEADVAAAKKLKATGTPTVLINDVLVPGSLTTKQLDSLVVSETVAASRAARGGSSQ